jgi:hypothetical protein
MSGEFDMRPAGNRLIRMIATVERYENITASLLTHRHLIRLANVARNDRAVGRFLDQCQLHWNKRAMLIN